MKIVPGLSCILQDVGTITSQSERMLSSRPLQHTNPIQHKVKILLTNWPDVSFPECVPSNFPTKQTAFS